MFKSVCNKISPHTRLSVNAYQDQSLLINAKELPKSNTTTPRFTITTAKPTYDCQPHYLQLITTTNYILQSYTVKKLNNMKSFSCRRITIKNSTVYVVKVTRYDTAKLLNIHYNRRRQVEAKHKIQTRSCRVTQLYRVFYFSLGEIIANQ